jgi:hypothetical protein
MAVKGRKLEKQDMRIIGVEISGDGENWMEAKNMDSWGAVSGGLAHIIDLIANGERVFLRTLYVDVYRGGTNGLPKSGAVYELQLLEVQPVRQLIEGSVVKQMETGRTPHAYQHNPSFPGHCSVCNGEEAEEIHGGQRQE